MNAQSAVPWIPAPSAVTGAKAFIHANGLAVIAGLECCDGVVWRHVSVSRSNRIPDHEDMALVKMWFFGSKLDALEYWPRKDEHINHHPYCRHLWGRNDGERCAPDFRRFDPYIGALSI